MIETPRHDLKHSGGPVVNDTVGMADQLFGRTAEGFVGTRWRMILGSMSPSLLLEKGGGGQPCSQPLQIAVRFLRTAWASGESLAARIRRWHGIACPWPLGIRQIGLPQFLFRAFFVLACFALPQLAVAQTSDVTVSIADSANVSEAADTIEFTVTLSERVGEDVVLDLSYRPVGAFDSLVTLADDLGELPRMVTIEDGEISAQVVVPINNDNIVERTEGFAVTIAENTFPDGVRIDDAVARGRIEDDDTAEFTLAVDKTSAHEGRGVDGSGNDGATFTFTITLSAPVGRPSTVTYVVEGSGMNEATTVGPGSDLAADQTNGDRIAFAIGETTAEFTIRIRADGNAEPDETFTVRLTAPSINVLDRLSSLTVGSPGSREITIENDDGLPNNETAELDLRVPSTYTYPADVEAEGGLHFFTVEKEGNTMGLEEEVTFTYSTSDGTATAGDDYTAVTNQEVTIAGSAAGATLVFTTMADNIVEADETFTVTYESETVIEERDVGFVDSNTTEVTIVDQDIALVSLEGEISALESTENISFTVNLAEGDNDSQTGPVSVSEDVTVTWAITDGTATVSDDVDGEATGTVTIEAGDSSATFDIPIVNDTRVEGDETFTVTLTAATVPATIDADRVLLSSTAISATGTITEDDSALISLSPATLREAENENEAFSYTVSLSAAVDEAISLTWTATDGTATVSTDLVEASNTVSFAADTTTAQTFTITPFDDNLDEGSETFTVTLTATTPPLPNGVTIAQGSATSAAIIADDDGPRATVDIADSANVSEGAGTIEFTVTLSTRVREDVVLDLEYRPVGAVDSLVTLADDLGELPRMVTIEDGEISAQVVVPINDDEIVERTEGFSVTISENTFPIGVTIDDAVARGRIEDNDAAEFSLTVNQMSAPEGRDVDRNEANEEGAIFTFTISLSATLGRPAQVRYLVEGTGDNPAIITGPGSDLEAGQTNSDRIEFAAGETTAEFTIRIRADGNAEPSETFTVTLDSPTIDGLDTLPGLTIGSPASQLITITNDDGEPNTGTAEVDLRVPSTFRYPETADGEGGLHFFTVEKEGNVMGLEQAVTFTYSTSDGTATAGDDYTAVTDGERTISSSEVGVTLVFPALIDNIVEADETFTVTYESETVAFADGDTTEVTIVDQDIALVSLEGEESALENTENISFTVNLLEGDDDNSSDPTIVSEDVTVTWTITDGTATVSDDIDGEATGTVTIEAGENSATFDIPIVNDTRVEGNETFTVTLTAATVPVAIDADRVLLSPTAISATGTITEDDTALISLSPPTLTAAENETFNYTVSLSAAVDEAISLTWTATDGSATVSTDLEEASNTVSFAANTTTAQTFTITPADDDLDESNETFTVTLAATTPPLPNGVMFAQGSSSSAATITENATATLSIASTATAAEGSPVEFAVSLSAAISSPVTVRWTATATGDNPATLSGAGSDLASGQATTGTVEFAADSAANATQTVTIATNNDTRVEGSETFTVTLSQDTQGGNLLPDGVSIPTATDEGVGTITENDAATVSIAPTGSAAEGSPVVFAVSLSTAVSDAVTVRWTATATGLGAATLAGANSDLTVNHALTGTVVFPADDTSNKTVSLATVNDARVEGSETFTVTLSQDTQGGNPLPDGVTIPTTTDEGIGTITEDDAATASLSLLSLSAAEGGTFTFTATLSAPVSESVTVRWTATSAAPSAGAATLSGAGSDLASGQATTGTVEFAADSAANATQTFMIATNNDTRVEGSETFTVTLSPDTTGGTSLPNAVTIPSAGAAATGTITEDETAVVSIASTATAAESSPVVFAVSLSAASQNAVTVRWTVTSAAPDFGAATLSGANSDLGAGQVRTGTVVFAPDDTADKTVSLTTVDDTRVEGSETFTVTLSQDTQGGNPLPAGVSIPTATEAGTGTITEDDTAELSIASAVTGAEGSTLGFAIRLSAASALPVTVRWTATSPPGDGAATLLGANSDLASTQILTGTVVFAADDTTDKTASLATATDDRVEGSETFTVTLSPDDGNPLPDGVEIGADDEATATITEGDAATVSIAATATAVEGSPVAFTVSLSAASQNAVTVRWTATSAAPSAGAATLSGAGSDFTSTQDIEGTVVFAPDDNTQQTISLATLDDALVEGSETFTVTLSPDTDNPLPTGVSIPTATGAGIGTITEDEAAVVSIATTATAAEGSPVEFAVSLNAASQNAVTVRWTATAGSGTGLATLSGASSDLTASHVLTGTVVFATDDTANKTVSLATVNDTRVEGPETFTVTLSQDTDGGNLLPAGVSLSTTARAGTGTITEDDTATVSIASAASAEEGETISFTVELDNPVAEGFDLGWTASNGTATVEDDLDEQSGTVTISANSQTATIEISITNDEDAEGSETFTVVLSGPPTGLVNIAATRVTVDQSPATGTINASDAAPVVDARVSINNQSVAENVESGNAAFTISLTETVSSAVVLDVAYIAGTADPATDLGSGRLTTVTIPADTLTVTLDVPIENDDIVEGTETYTVRLSANLASPLPDGVTITDSDGTGTITEDDTAVISLSPPTLTAGEDETFDYTVSLSAAVDEAINLTWTATNGSATVSTDLTATSNTVNFTANTTTAQTFTITPVADGVDEGNETFTVTLTATSPPLPTGVSIAQGSASSAATITDSDAAAPVVDARVSINNQSVAENVESGNAAFTISLTETVSSAVVLDVAYIAGTADPATDLGSGRLTTVTIPADTLTVALDVPIENDDIVEGTETYTVRLSANLASPLPDGVTITDSDGTGTITEDDTAVISLSPPTLTAGEDETFDYTVSLSAAVDQAISLTWTATNGSATVSTDLTAASNTVNFTANTTTAQTFTITPVADGVDEGNETFTVTLTATSPPLPTGVSIAQGSASSAATITDSDTAAPVVDARVSINNQSVAENVAGGNAAFTISLTETVSSAVVLDVAYIAGTADPATDLGSGRLTTVTISADTLTVTLDVPIENDDIVEGTETYTVRLSANLASPLPDGVIISDSDGTGTITEDDAAVISLSPLTLTAGEDETFNYTVSLSAAVDEAISLTWTATDGSATVSTDLAAASNTVSFVANSITAQTFIITPINDGVDEGDETFTVTLTATTPPLPTGVSIAQGSASSAATITDSDAAAPVVDARVSINNQSVAENVAGGNAAFTISLTETVSSAVVLDVAYIAGTADPATDLGSGRLTTVTIPADTLTVTLDVPIEDDDIVEGTETYTVRLSANLASPLPDGVTIADSDGTGTITEDDTAVISLSPATLTAGENETFNYTVSLSAAVDQAISLTWTATDGSATVSTDLAATSNTVSFAVSTTTAQTFTITPVDDDLDEGNETFTVTLTATTPPLPTGVTIAQGSASSAATIIDNDEAPEVNARVSINNRSVAENVAGGNAAFTVTLTETVSSAVVLDVAYIAGTANPATDLGSDRPSTVTIPADTLTATLNVPIENDTLVEGTETFTVRLSANSASPLPDGVIISDSDGTGTITEDDAAVISLSPPTLTAGENETFNYTVSLSAAVDQAISLTWTATDGTATVSTDLATASSTVSFAANTTTAQTFTITPIDDNLRESSETFTVTLTATTPPLPVGVMIDQTQASSVATITDNDVTDGGPVPSLRPSILIESRRAEAGAALRRHANRLGGLTGTVVRNRFDMRETRHLNISQNGGDGALAVGSEISGTHWGTWIDGTWAGFNGNTSGRQADVYGGVDYLGGGNSDRRWLIGALIGSEAADLDIGEARYQADYTHFGFYGGVWLSERLLFDGAITYGMADPDVSLGDVSASYGARRITAHGALTGDFGIEYGSAKIEPQLSLLYSRERLGAFTDSVGGVARRETLELGRLSAGPRMTWDFDGGQVAVGARVQWDFLELEDGVDGRVSGATDVMVMLDLAPGVSLSIQAGVDGIGITDDFRSFGGSIKLNVRF